MSHKSIIWMSFRETFRRTIQELHYRDMSTSWTLLRRVGRRHYGTVRE
jgi:hypothetical protein